MKDIQFPIFKTKVDGLNQEFDLADPAERKKYFEKKAGKEIEKLRDFLKENTFIAYLLGKKNSGKGTYAKMLKEIVAPDKIEHISIGDMVRTLDDIVRDKQKRQQFVLELAKNYRGYLPLEDIIKSLETRSTAKLLPSELILALIKMKIAQGDKKALFIDGFPREMDQVSYSLFFRDLIGYRDDPDVFVLIDAPEAVIDERIKYRVICPLCQTSRNLKLLPTKQVGFDSEKQEFYLTCDNSECAGKRMVKKEGDHLGIEPIKERLKTDEELIKKAFSLYGVPKILLRNTIPIDKVKENMDEYELTSEYSYAQKNGAIKITEKPWKIKDDSGELAHSLLAPPMVVALIKQLTEALDL